MHTYRQKYTHTHTYIYIYIYIYVWCLCVRARARILLQIYFVIRSEKNTSILEAILPTTQISVTHSQTVS